MSRKTHRAAAIAAAATLFATFIGAGTSGAFAEDQVPQPSVELTAGEEPATDTGPRFVAPPVVSPLPASEMPVESNEPAEPLVADAPAASLEKLIDEVPTGGPLSRNMTCLAEAVYFESRGEPVDGQLAVARVVINRAESPAFPDDYCSVVTQPAQFSFVRHGIIPKPDMNSQAWKRAKAIARIAHEELWDSPADDALFFHATYVRPSWARTKLAAATIERHIFYK